MNERILADKIERWRVDRLVPYARNPRTHSPEQVLQIAESIREFGFTNPVLVDRAGGIIAGHGRVLAAKELGLEEVPVVRLDHLSEKQKRAYVIADNKLALNAGWDEELLALELMDLRLEDYDLDLTGFAEQEIEAILRDLEGRQDGLTEKDAVPEAPARAVSRPGDLWLLGEHRLLCGDALERQSLERLLGEELADMVFTDPPYNVDYGSSSTRGRPPQQSRKILNDNLGKEFAQFLQQACASMLAVTNGALYIAMASTELLTLDHAFARAGGHRSTFIIWAKSHFTLGRADYQRQYEPILYGWKASSQHYWCGARDEGDVWHFDKPQSNDLHPTMKPVELIERAVQNSSKARDVVLDPFAGSGSTGIACETTGRRARLLELDPRYCDVIIRRWEEFTGEAATLEGQGATFDEVAEQRDEQQQED